MNSPSLFDLKFADGAHYRRKGAQRRSFTPQDALAQSADFQACFGGFGNLFFFQAALRAGKQTDGFKGFFFQRHKQNTAQILLFSSSIINSFPKGLSFILPIRSHSIKEAYSSFLHHKFFTAATQQGGEFYGRYDLAVYIIETGATVRTAAKHFGISKSTVDKDLAQRLPYYNRLLYKQVRQVLDTNKAQRHIRGGMATREKYLKKL